MKSNQRVFACTECRLGDIELDRCDEGACTNCGASIPREQLDKLALLEDHFRTFMKSLTECIDELDLTASPDPAAAAELEALFIDPPGAHALSDRHHLYYQMGVIRAKFYLSSGNEAKAICEWDSLCPTS